MQLQKNKYFLIDMATAMDSIPTFEGKDQEDIITWFNELELISKISEFQEDEILKFTLLKLRGKPREWAYMELKKDERMTFYKLKKSLTERFTYESGITRSSNEILRMVPIKNISSFEKFLQKVNLAFKWNAVTEKNLIELVVRKGPADLKGLLIERAAKTSGWIDFYMDVERALYLFKRDQEGNEKRIASGKNFKRKIRAKFFHIRNSSTTLKDEKKPERKVASSHTKSGGNPFYKMITVNNKEHRALIDTGADISLMHKKNLPKDAKLEKSGERLRSASGHIIESIEKARDIKAKIGNTEFKFSPKIVENKPEYTIIGAETLYKYPEILLETPILKNIKMRNKIQSVELLDEIEKEFADIFKTEIDQMSLCTAATHKIETTTDKPIFNRNSRLPVNYEEVINKEISKLKSLGIIQPSKSPWCSRIVPVPKPDGTLRMCIDYRPLNLITVKDAYPIPMISEILDTVTKSRIFSTLDATSGYYQIAVDPRDIEKTAFGWKGGLYEFTRMPFGLCNAPATFQRAMDSILRNELWKFAIAYLDDIIIFSETEEQHREHLKIVMGKLKAAGIALNQKKCKFFKKEIKILGNIITEGKVLPDPEKIDALKNYEVPNTIKELRSFMGLANYVREFIPKFSEISAPMSDILKGEEKRSVKQIKWTEEELESFHKIKKAIIEITYRAQPNFDNEFILTTDASSIAIGAILTQVGKDGKEEMISAFSRKLDSTQENYSVTDKELLAVVKSVEHYKHYLLGKEFVLRTDHKAIEYLWSTQNDSSRLLRWALKLQEYKFRLEYVKGENNIADGLSRPIERKINHIEINQKYSEDQKAKILHEYHRKLGHGSPESMKFSINQKYKWKSMFKDIENYVKKCDICLRGGEARVNTKNRIIMSTRPNELWVCDLIGRIQCKNGRNKFIFIAIDHYSKWIETKVLATKDAKSTKDAIEELIIKKHGIPEKIMSDNGLEFMNSAIKELAKKNNIEWIFNSPEHHQTVGVVERANQSLMNKLKKLTDYGKLPWEPKLKEATEAMNYSFQRCLRTSPYIFKYARTPTFEIDKELGVPEIIIPKTDSKNNRDINFDSYAKKNIEKGKIEIKRKFNINDPVLIFKQPLSDKFKENWKQGYTVLKHIEPDAYIVSDGKSEYRLNKSHIKLDTSKVGEGDVAKGVYKRVLPEPHAITKE